MNWNKYHFIVLTISLILVAAFLTILTVHLTDLATQTNDIRKAKVQACQTLEEGARALCIKVS